MEKEPTKQEQILSNIGHVIHEECKTFALNQMQPNDFILLSDAHFKPTENIKIQRGEDKELHTIKNSSREKYNDFYEKKLINIIDKLLKDHA